MHSFAVSFRKRIFAEWPIISEILWSSNCNCSREMEFCKETALRFAYVVPFLFRTTVALHYRCVLKDVDLQETTTMDRYWKWSAQQDLTT